MFVALLAIIQSISVTYSQSTYLDEKQLKHHKCETGRPKCKTIRHPGHEDRKVCNSSNRGPCEKV